MKRTSPSQGSDEGVAKGIKSAKMERAVFTEHQEGRIMNIITVGIDLVKKTQGQALRFTFKPNATHVKCKADPQGFKALTFSAPQRLCGKLSSI